MKNGKQAADTLIWIYIIKLLRIRLHGALPQLKYVYIFTYLCLLDSKYFRPRKLHTKLDLTRKDWVYHAGLYIAGDSNSLYLIDSKYAEWVEICNLDTLMGEQAIDWDGIPMVVPINFEAKYIINGIVSEKIRHYCKIGEDPQDDSYVEYIMTEFPEEFNGLLEK